MSEGTQAPATPAQQLLADYAAGTRDFLRANLRDANLRDANLSGASLYRADLHGANLRDANLRDANLSGANLRGADLSGADLYRADLSGANLYRADLSGANLRGVKNIPTGSHDIIAELLLQTAGADIHRRMVAGVVLVSRDWCWRDFSVLARRHWSLELRQWIVATLSQYDGFATCFEDHSFFSESEESGMEETQHHA